MRREYGDGYVEWTGQNDDGEEVEETAEVTGATVDDDEIVVRRHFHHLRWPGSNSGLARSGRRHETVAGRDETKVASATIPSPSDADADAPGPSSA